MIAFRSFFAFAVVLSCSISHAQSANDFDSKGYPFKTVIQDKICSNDHVTLGFQKQCIAYVNVYIEKNVPPILPLNEPNFALILTSKLSQELCKKPADLDSRWNCYENTRDSFIEIARQYKVVSDALLIQIQLGRSKDLDRRGKFNQLNLLAQVEAGRLDQLIFENKKDGGNIDRLDFELSTAPLRVFN